MIRKIPQASRHVWSVCFGLLLIACALSADWDCSGWREIPPATRARMEECAHAQRAFIGDDIEFAAARPDCRVYLRRPFAPSFGSSASRER